MMAHFGRVVTYINVLWYADLQNIFALRYVLASRHVLASQTGDVAMTGRGAGYIQYGYF